MKHLKLFVIGALLAAAMLPMELFARSYMHVWRGDVPANFECGRVAITFPVQGESHAIRIAGDWGNRSYPVTEVDGITFTVSPDEVKGDKGEETAPTNFSIIGNYPNPFNGGTTIHYRLDHSGRASVRVCDLSGRVVATLVDSLQPAGSHSVIWEGTGESSAPAPAGIYFCKLGVGDKVEARRMVLLK